MRIWHKSLIPNLCDKHLLAVWREGLGAYKIITENKNGYRNHLATQEYINCPELLHDQLSLIRQTMLIRGWKPKELPAKISYGGDFKEWQSLEEQIERLKKKNCKCVDKLKSSSII